MSEEERESVVTVIKDRDTKDETEHENYSDEILVLDEEERDDDIIALTPETTLQEVDTDVHDVQVETNQDDTPLRTNSKSPIRYSCPECPMKFNLQIRLNKHLRVHHKKDKIDIDKSKNEVNKKSKAKNAFKLKIKLKKDDPKPAGGVACTECGKMIKSYTNLQRHMEDIHNPGVFPCKGGCGKIFTSRNKMGSHYSRNCNPLNPNGRKNKSIL